MKKSKTIVVYLALLSMLAYISTDMYLPAFKHIEVSLSALPEQIAFSLSIFLSGLAVGQFVWGVISDKYGQKRSLICGLCLFTLSSLGLAFCSEVWQLLALRLFQAIGVSAPAVIWQAFTIKRFSKHESQQIFATVMPLVALSPAIAPQMGVLILEQFGWNSIFIFLTLVGVLLLLYSMTLENKMDENKHIDVLYDTKNILMTRAYLGNVIMYATSSAMFFSYLTGIPEVMSQFGYGAQEIAFSFIPQTVVFIIGGYSCKRALKIFNSDNVLKFFIAIFCSSSFLVFVITQYEFTHILILLVPFWLVSMANGAMYPIFVNRALSSVADKSPATAAGLQNSLVILVSSFASGIVASYASNSLYVIGMCVLASLLLFLSGYFYTEEYM